MDLWERRLQTLEIDYQETIAAGERAEQRRRIEAIVSEHRAEYQLVSDHETDACGIDTPAMDGICEPEQMTAPQPCSIPRDVTPMSQSDIERVKAHMSTIKLMHEPSWASAISDE